MYSQAQVEQKDAQKLDYRSSREWLLRDTSEGGKPELLSHVRIVMGDKYCSAVRACIGGMELFHLPIDAPQNDPVIATLLQQAYLRLVVDVLNGIDV